MYQIAKMVCGIFRGEESQGELVFCYYLRFTFLRVTLKQNSAKYSIEEQKHDLLRSYPTLRTETLYSRLQYQRSDKCEGFKYINNLVLNFS